MNEDLDFTNLEKTLKRRKERFRNVASVEYNIKRSARTVKLRKCEECGIEKNSVKLFSCMCGLELFLCPNCKKEHTDLCDYSFCQFCTFPFEKEDQPITCEFCSMPVHDMCMDEHLREAHFFDMMEGEDV